MYVSVSVSVCVCVRVRVRVRVCVCCTCELTAGERSVSSSSEHSELAHELRGVSQRKVWN